MTAEDTSGTAGTTGHVIHITGEWAEDLAGYSIRMNYDSSNIEIDSTDSISLDDAVVQPSPENSWSLTPNYNNSEGWLTAGIINWRSSDIDYPIPSGGGTLLTIEFTIKEGATNGPTTLELDDTAVPTHCIYVLDSDFTSIVPYLEHGTLTISGGTEPSNNPPNEPSSPDPADGATNVELNTDLSWSCSDPDEDPLTYDVYFDTDPDPSLAASDHTSASYTPEVLAYDTAYHWKIVAEDDQGASTEGPIWSFTTKVEDGPGPGPDNEVPVADANGPYTGYVGVAITFDASASTDSDGTITGYRWDFDDDGIYDTTWLTSPTITQSYDNIGNYTVTLQVKDNDDATDTNTTMATISNLPEDLHPPVANANGPYTGITFQNITFDGSESYDSDGTITNYTWDFGDGTSGYDVQPVHKYTTAGVFTVTLTVKDNDSLSTIDSTTATITAGDSDGDGLSDMVEESLGSDPANDSDVKGVDIENVQHFLVDNSGDGQFNLFYNAISGNTTQVNVTDDNQLLIDENGDGKWDYRYDPASDSITDLEEETTREDSEIPWMMIAVITVAIAVIGIIVFLYKEAYI
jgi:PKD repeat protein